MATTIAEGWPAPEKKIYTQAELDQAIIEAGFAAEPAGRLLDAAAQTIQQCDRLYGRTKKTTEWIASYVQWLNNAE